MNISVTERFFDITLTSNSFQDIFPENTVSFFRAKLPTKLIFPRNVPYKVALNKLTFINSVNNIGSGANTKIYLNNDSLDGIQVHLPEVSVDDPEGFINVLSAQFKEAVPNLFQNYQTLQSFRSPFNIVSNAAPLENEEEMQADAPSQDEALDFGQSAAAFLWV